jgi:hypothetical protein
MMNHMCIDTTTRLRPRISVSRACSRTMLAPRARLRSTGQVRLENVQAAYRPAQRPVRERYGRERSGGGM